MAVVQSGLYSGDYLIDDLIQVETIGRKIQLRDAVTGQVIENIGNYGGDVYTKAASTTYAAAQSSYGTSADAVLRALYLISSGKWATHQAGPNYNVAINNN